MIRANETEVPLIYWLRFEVYEVNALSDCFVLSCACFCVFGAGKSILNLLNRKINWSDKRF